MTQIERGLDGYPLLTLVVALVAALLTVLVEIRRGSNRVHSLVFGGVAGSLVCLFGVTLQPSAGTPSGVELMPFTNLGSASGLAQLIGNLVLTMPSGFLTGLATRGFRRTVRFGIIVCVGIELVQLVLPIGRVASTEDVLVTSLGWIVGASAAQIALLFVGRARSD